MSEPLRNSKHEQVAVLLAAGGSIHHDGDTLELSRSRAYHVAGLPEVRQRVSELRNEATSRAVGRLSDAASEAVDTLRAIASDPAGDPKDKIAAAKAILGAFKPLSELGELRDRLAEIEAAVGSGRQKTAA